MRTLVGNPCGVATPVAPEGASPRGSVVQPATPSMQLPHSSEIAIAAVVKCTMADLPSASSAFHQKKSTSHAMAYA
jgi:hypothetical protein